MNDVDECDECPACHINRVPAPVDGKIGPHPVGQHAMHYLSGVRALAGLEIDDLRAWLCPMHRDALAMFEAVGEASREKEVSTGFTEKDVKKMLCNPIYVGMGPYSASMTKEQWIKSATKRIKDNGAEDFLKCMIDCLREAFEAGACRECYRREKEKKS